MTLKTTMRDPLIDVMKGFAIFLVIWGHCIQCLGEGMIVLSQPIGKLIYLFHMPMFFFLSGYVSINALSRKLVPLIESRLKSLFLPMCLWALIGLCVKFAMEVQTLHEPLSGRALLKQTLIEINGAYWFIWVLLDCVFYAWCISFFIRGKRVWLWPASSLFLLLLPEIPFIHLNAFKCMYPFFVAGILFRRFDVFAKIRRHMIPNVILWGGDFQYAI